MVISDVQIEKNAIERFSRPRRRQLRSLFHREGFVKVPDIVPDDVRESIRKEALGLLDDNAERRDLRLATTGNTKRAMSVVRSEVIATAPFISSLYRSAALTSILADIAGEALYPCPVKDEEFLITRQERAADTHGWHWGDFSFALIWLVIAPPVAHGGMLQCVPHTEWNKADPRIHEYLCEYPIRTYGFVTGDIYFLRTDTTLHRTVPLVQDSTRVILNMTWASRKDLDDGPVGDDRWWESSAVEAAQPVADLT
jgi:L-lysine 4-chlorinase